MTPQLAALQEIAEYLAAKRIPYAVIGGLAAAAWGQPRATHDADVTVMVPFEKEKEFLEELLGRFPGRITDALDFARKSRVALVSSYSGVPIDVALGIPGYQEEMIRRAVELELGPGVVARVCDAGSGLHQEVAAGIRRRLG